MQQILFMSLIFLSEVLTDIELAAHEECFVDGLVGACVALPACAQIASRFNDHATAEEALKLAHRRKCGFTGLNMKVCCLEDELKVNTSSRFGDNETASYVELIEQPPLCGKGYLPISDGQCTRRAKRHSNMIQPILAGGKPIGLGIAPWMVVLGYMPSSNFWECGGSIITRRHILTAAHCINGRLSLVRVGELDLAANDDGASPADYLIKKMIPHEQYDNRKHVNDIGILELEQDIEFTNLIKPICLPDLKQASDWPHVGGKASVTGWGRVSQFGVQSTMLLYATIKIFENSLCQQQFQNYSDAVIDDRVLCAGDLAGVKDSCKGDSGGPLMVKTCDNDGSWYYTQVGVVSYGLGCARAGYPGVYTRVAHYNSWIREKTGKL